MNLYSVAFNEALFEYSSGRAACGRVYCWVADPQVAVEIAREARDTIQDLDARIRGHDNKGGFRADDGSRGSATQQYTRPQSARLNYFACSLESEAKASINLLRSSGTDVTHCTRLPAFGWINESFRACSA